MRLLTVFWLILFLSPVVTSQNLNRVPEPDVMNNPVRQEIKMPAIEGIEILKCDFHMHTVFSDGQVWPTVRVQEAWYDGLDAIAITDHIEYRPHKKHLSGSLNEVHAIAKPEADKYGIILVKAAEITRSMPPGHLNALFLKDLDALDVDDYMEAIEEAHNQGAYIFWNHPGWTAQQPDTCKWWDVHETLVENGWVQGIEVYNYGEWYPVALDWCKDKNLTYMANSDVHGVISHIFNDKIHPRRPLTLVFAREKNEESLKEALMRGEAVAFFAGKMAGPEKLLKQVFEASVLAGKPFNLNNSGSGSVKLTNLTDIPFVLEDENGKELKLGPSSSVITQVNNLPKEKALKYQIINFYHGTSQHPEVEINL